MRNELPSGTVTFLFTDIEGSTNLLHELGAEAYAEVLAEHRHVIRSACAAHGGVEVDTQGDALFVAFPTAPGAVAAASEIQQAFADGRLQVRLGLHTGTPLVTSEGYVGVDVHRAARIAAAGHGGQTLLSSSTAALAEVRLRDLGEHRLKDLAAPERIYQLGDRDHPRLKSLYRTNLPIPATGFVGRATDIESVLTLLRDPGTRVLTLTGPGGTGKTRLALQAAAEAADEHPDGVWWVPLAPLRDPELVPAEIARALDIRGDEGSSQLETLIARLADSSALLLLDNAEHLLPRLADHVSVLVAACPTLAVLVTSRERLGIAAERLFPVPPLLKDDGVALFLARARALEPEFELSEDVRELCGRLDQLPLAIELAAARTPLFTPGQLLARLSERLDLVSGARDAEPRQRTLRATMSWSYDLLEQDERRLFARLSIFAGGFDLAAAEEVSGARPELLRSLIDKSLVRRRHDRTAEPRFWLLEIVREFAAEQLAARGEAADAEHRHGDFYLRLAEAAAASLGGEEYESSVARIAREHDNLRVALGRACSHGDVELAYRLATAVLGFWQLRGQLEEGARAAAVTLALPTDDALLRGRLLLAAGALERGRGAHARALQLHEEGLALLEAAGDAYGIAQATSHLAVDRVLIDSRPDRAAELAERALELRRPFGEAETAQGLHTLGLVRMVAGQLEAAQAAFEESLQLSRAHGLLRAESVALSTLGQTMLLRGDATAARARYFEVLGCQERLDSPYLLAVALDGLAIVGASVGAAECAARLRGAATKLHEEMGGRPLPYIAKPRAAAEAKMRSLLGEAYERLVEEGRALPPEAARAEAFEVPAPGTGAGTSPAR